MANEVPTLSVKGWLEDPKAKADRILAYYLTSNHSQTNIFRGSIASLPKLVQQYGNDADALRTKSRQQLEQLFAGFFDQVFVETLVELVNPQDPNRLNLTVHIQVMQDGVPYDLANLLEISNRTITGRLILYNNQGIVS